MERARARLWDGAPEGRKREDPETWIGPFTSEEENVDKNNNRRGFRWNFREPGGEAWMVQLLATDRTSGEMAEQLLGEGNLVNQIVCAVFTARCLTAMSRKINRVSCGRASVPSRSSRLY